MKFYVYTYYDPRGGLNHPIYVGKGTSRRAYFHLRSCANPILSRTLEKIRAAGLKPAVEIVFRTDDETEAIAREVALIAQYGRRNIGTGTLCNLTDGGEGVRGRVVTPETRKRISEANAGRLVGRKISDEHKRNIAAAQRGKPHPRKSGTTHSPEARKRMSEARRGKPGPAHTPESKDRIRAALTGITRSAETRQKVAAAIREWHAEGRGPNLAHGAGGKFVSKAKAVTPAKD